MTIPFRMPEEVERAIPIVGRHVRGGGLLGYPTETVYGLGSAPTDEAVAALALLKGRDPGKPFLLLVASRAMAEGWGLFFTPAASVLADVFWPGPLTLVLRGAEGRLPDRLRGQEGGFAVRHTSHRGIARLVAALDMPLTSTSANRPGRPPAPGADNLAEVFESAVSARQLMVLDGGVLGNVPPSTLVDCTQPSPQLVREGAIPRTELRRVAGRFAP